MAGDHAAHLSALDAYSDLNDVDTAAQVLCLIVAAFLDDDLVPLDALYTNLEPCRLVLARHDDLYAILKECHGSRNFDTLRNYGALRRQEESAEISQILDDMLPELVEFVRQGLPTWSPDAEAVPDEDSRAHITSLGAPSVSHGGPTLLLHELGRFSKDPELERRTNNIFVKGRHTFLVNTSGSGKTRLTLEGLSQHWGLYFVGMVDDNGIGSPDLMYLLEDYIGRSASFFPLLGSLPSPQKLAENVRVTRRRLRQLLLCRLLVFDLFAEHVHGVGITAEHKKLWLLIQALPRTIGANDVYYMLLMQVAHMDDFRTRDHIAHLLAKFRGLFGSDFHLFVVIDEAQVIFKSHERAFREENGDTYPILREMIDGINDEFPRHEVSFVTAGTQIPKAGFQNSSNVDRHRWCSDTGAFDDESLHREYVSRYLPPSYVKTKSGKCFLQLVWDWCRGRYRFTDGLMSTLMRDGFRSPHTVLNAYLKTGTGVFPTDNLEFVRAEDHECADIWIRRFDCSVLDAPAFKPSTSDLQDVLFHYSVATQHPEPFNSAHIQLVTLGFGRFIDQQMSRIVVDEPIILLAAAHWFCTTTANDPDAPNHRPLKSSFLDILQQYPPSSPRILSYYITIHITHALAQGFHVNKVFTFPHSKSPAWAKQKAEIVTLYPDDGKAVQYAVADLLSPTSLATAPPALEDTISWLVHETPDYSPFCLLSTGHPHLIFVLRLSEGVFIRVMLHASHTLLQASDLQRIIKDMDESFSAENPILRQRNISALSAIPSHSPAARRPSILRIIASFPVAPSLSRGTTKGTRGVASLNTGFFKTHAAMIPASVILRRMMDAVTSGKRERRSEEPSVKIIKQNMSLQVPLMRGSGRVRARS